MEELSFATYIILFLTGALAGFVDSIAGGGGIVTVPVLLSIGIPPHLALGTNKLQSSFGSLTAAVNYTRKGLVDPRKMMLAICCTIIGAVTGTLTIQQISTEFLRHAIPIFLAAILVYSIFSPSFGESDRSAKINRSLFHLSGGFILGFYDGFFGPGAGSFWTIGFVILLGYNLKTATAHTKVTNFTSNFSSLAVFLIAGKVLFLAGLVMGCGQICGAAIGSRLVIRNGIRFIRVIFLLVVSLTILKVMFDTYFAR